MGNSIHGPAAHTQSSTIRADLAMERYARGEDQTFGDVYDELAPRLHRLLLRMTGAAADDLLQQTFLQMHRHRGNFRRGAKVVPWAFAIARRLAIDWQRRQQLEVGAAGQAEAQEVAEAWCTHAMAEARQLASDLAAAFVGLPPAQRAAYVLVKQDGLSLVEAAQALGTTVMAVKLRLHRATETLRATLQARQAE